MRAIKRMTLILFGTMLASSALAGPAFAQDAADVKLDSPIRSFTLDPSETRVDLDIDFINSAETRRIVDLDLQGIPEGWDVGVWNAFFDFRITQFVVEPTDDTPGQRPRMRIRLPDPRPEPGDYSFTLIVTDAGDPSIEYDRARFTVGVPEAAPVDQGEVTVRAEFPVLQGPSNTSYEFEIIVKNDTADDHSVALAGAILDANRQPVQGWDLSFSPAFGEQKRISSVAISPRLDERINVQVSPPSTARPGEYLIPVSVETEEGELSATTTLRLVITGRGELLATTPSGRLSLNATAGKPTTNKLRLTNFGTGDLTNINLTADAPADWIVTFQIDTVTSLPVNNQIDVDVTITPPDNAVPGDYEVTLRGRGGNVSDNVVLRVTVAQSTIWGWLGIVLVIIVVGALIGLFWRLGRR